MRIRYHTDSNDSVRPDSINGTSGTQVPVSKADYSKKKSYSSNVLAGPNQWKLALMNPELPTTSAPYASATPQTAPIDDSLIDSQLLEGSKASREKRKHSDYEVDDAESILSEIIEDSTAREVRRRTEAPVKQEPEDDQYRGSLFARRSLRSKAPAKPTGSTLNAIGLSRGRHNNSLSASAMVRCQSEPRYGRRQTKAPSRLLGRGEHRNSGLSHSYLTEVPAWLQLNGSAQIENKLVPGQHNYNKRSSDSSMDVHTITSFKQDPTTMEYFDFDQAATSQQAAASIPAYAWDARSDPGATPTYRPGQAYYDSAYHTGYPSTPAYSSVAPSVSSYTSSSYATSGAPAYDYDYYRTHGQATQSYSSYPMSSSYATAPMSTSPGYGYSEPAGGPYVCDFPGCQQKQQYTRMCELNKHKKTHERNFPCRHSPNCKAFSTAKDRNRHETTIHKAEFGGEEYICQDCGKSCSRKDNLRDHRRRRHGMD